MIWRVNILYVYIIGDGAVTGYKQSDARRYTQYMAALSTFST